MDKKQTTLKLAKTIMLLCLTLLGAVALVFALAQTNPGKSALARLAAAALSNDESREVELGRLSGWIPFHFQLERLALSDAQGSWLILDGIRVQWSPLALLGGRFSFRELTARGVEILRMPEGREEAQERTPPFPEGLGALLRLQVDRLGAERILLAEAVAGESAQFTLEAKIGETSPEGEKQSLFRLEQTDRPGASLAVHWVYHVTERLFSWNARFEEVRGGLVGRRIGLEGPLNFSFVGKGPARDLAATLEARAGGIGMIESRVLLRMEKELRVLAEGKITVDPEITHVPIPGMEGGLPFNLSLRFPETGALRIERFALEAGDIALDLEASFHPQEQTLEGHYNLLLEDLATLQPLLKEDLKGSMKAEGYFSGPLLRPRFTLRMEVTEASGLGAKASRMEAAFHLNLLKDLGSSFPQVGITGSGAMEGFVYQGLDGLSRKRINWEISLHGPEEDGIHISHFLLKSGEDSLQLSGIIDPSELKGALDIAFESGAPASLIQGFGLDLPWLGPTRLHGSVQGEGRPLFLKTEFHANSALFDDPLPSFLVTPQGEISYGATFTLNHDKILTVSRLWLDGAGASLEAQGSLDLNQELLVSSWEASFPDPSLFLSIPNLAPKGPLQWTGAVEGPLGRLNLSTKAEARDMEVSGVLLEKAAVGLEGDYTPSLKKGGISLELFQEDRWIKARGDFSLDRHTLDLSGISIEGFESALKGKATLDLEGREAQGELRGKVSDLSLLLGLLGQEIRGSAKGEAVFRLGGEDQVLALSIEASSLEGPFGTIRNLTVKSRMTGTLDRMEGFVDLALRDARISEIGLSSLVFKARGDTARADFQLDAAGHYREGFHAAASGRLFLSEEAQRLGLNRFQAHYGSQPGALSLTLTKPTSVIHEKGTLLMEEASFTLGTGSLRWSGTYGSNHADFDLIFQDLPLELLEAAGLPGFKGRASGSLVLEGPPEQPEARFELFAVDLRFEEVYPADLPSPSLTLQGSLADRALRADLAFFGLTPEPLKAAAAFPILFSLAPPSLSLDPRGRMELEIHGGAPLAHAALLLRLDNQALGGRVEADLSVTGPVAGPGVTGRLRVIDGAYENFRTGTILKEAALFVRAEEGRLVLEEARASDGERGSIALTGWFDFSSDRDFPYRVDIALLDATLIRHDTATARTRGDLVFSGNRRGALLSGEITVDPLDVRIPGRLSPEIADLEILEIRKGEEETPTPQARESASAPFVEVRVTIIIPARANLTGRGLDSEWQGRVEIQGPAGNPSVKGDLSVVRGHFNFLGKRLNLTRGVVSFLGDTPPVPLINVTAEGSTREMTAFLQLSGKVDAPELSLTSQPPLPDDEILSRLLFGRSVTQITPLQAVQLANALDVMAGRRGFDLVDHTRRMLGLDFLEIRDLGVELDEAALRAGKYLAENVYLELEQGLGPESGRASLQWEITPNITIQTEVGINAEAGAGIRWKWDY
jgi:translocation and assembly module TamB